MKCGRMLRKTHQRELKLFVLLAYKYSITLSCMRRPQVAKFIQWPNIFVAQSDFWLNIRILTQGWNFAFWFTASMKEHLRLTSVGFNLQTSKTDHTRQHFLVIQIVTCSTKENFRLFALNECLTVLSYIKLYSVWKCLDLKGQMATKCVFQ